MCCTVGARSPEQVEGVIGASDVTLSDEDVAEIERLLRELA